MQSGDSSKQQSSRRDLPTRGSFRDYEEAYRGSNYDEGEGYVSHGTVYDVERGLFSSRVEEKVNDLELPRSYGMERRGVRETDAPLRKADLKSTPHLENIEQPREHRSPQKSRKDKKEKKKRERRRIDELM